MHIVLLIVVVILLLGTWPNAPYGGWHHFGYWPSGTLGIVLLVLLILVLMGRL
jgi:succinate dehydrogenase hydrophobic anchor subunit